MLLKISISISATKKFFRKTLESFFKSFFFSCGGYQRIPKSPSSAFNSHMAFSQSYRELDKFYTEFTNYHSKRSLVFQAADFTNRWSKNKDKGNMGEKKKKKKKKVLASSPLMACNDKNYEGETLREEEDQEKKRLVFEGKRKEELSSCSKGASFRNCLVEEKLKELEMMMDRSNIEHVLDIEEVHHYYSRITCPAYLDMVDRFLMEMYAELTSTTLPASSAQGINNNRFEAIGAVNYQ